MAGLHLFVPFLMAHWAQENDVTQHIPHLLVRQLDIPSVLRELQMPHPTPCCGAAERGNMVGLESRNPDHLAAVLVACRGWLEGSAPGQHCSALFASISQSIPGCLPYCPVKGLVVHHKPGHQASNTMSPSSVVPCYVIYGEATLTMTHLSPEYTDTNHKLPRCPVAPQRELKYVAQRRGYMAG